MEGREVERDVRPELRDDPARQPVQLVVAVVPAGDQEGRQLDPDVRLVAEPAERLQDRLEPAGAELAVEVEIGRAHV